MAFWQVQQYGREKQFIKFENDMTTFDCSSRNPNACESVRNNCNHLFPALWSMVTPAELHGLL